jgi:hypothetical protein
MKIATLIILVAILAVIASANIPPGLHTSLPEPEPTYSTKCEEYLDTQPTDRIDQWIVTFRAGLMNNPELEQEVWVCVMDLYKMAETDQFMVRACRENPKVPFEDLAFKALAGHLDKCEVGITR